MNLIFCKLKKTKKKWIEFFSFFKKQKEHGFNFYELKTAKKYGFNFLQA